MRKARSNVEWAFSDFRYRDRYSGILTVVSPAPALRVIVLPNQVVSVDRGRGVCTGLQSAAAPHRGAWAEVFLVDARAAIEVLAGSASAEISSFHFSCSEC